MAATVTTSKDFDVQQLNDVVPGAFAAKTAFMGSILASQGAVVVNGEMPYGRDFVGSTIKIPYFGVIGEFADVSENVAATPVELKMKSEDATIGHSALAFEVSTWAQHSGPPGGDPYQEAARQVVESAQRKMDQLVIDEAATTPLIADYYSSTAANGYLDWDKVVDARAKWGDRQTDIVAMVIHSRTEADLRKLRDNQGRPLLLDSQVEGGLTKFCGIPLVISDRTPLTGSTMGAVTAVGTSPTLTITGTPNGAWNLKIVVEVSHASTTTIKFSTDGGNSYSSSITISDDSVPVALTDPGKDSLVGLNGLTGLSIAFGAGTFAANDTYTATALLKTSSLIVQKGALTFWYNRQLMQLETDRDILKANDVAAMHMFRAVKLYRRRVGGVLPGVVAIKHNVRSFVG